MALTRLFCAGLSALLLAALATPAHADLSRDLARLIQDQGSDPLGFIRGLRRLDVDRISRGNVQGALARLPREIRTSRDVQATVVPIKEIRISGSNIEIDREHRSNIPFGQYTVRLGETVRARVRTRGRDVTVDEISGVKVGYPNWLYKLKKVVFTTENGKPVAKVTLKGYGTVTVSLPESAAPKDPLSDGMDPELLKDVQTALETLGYDVTPDGEWGPQTKAAVKAFQTDREIEVDGRVGPGTRRHLREALAALPGQNGGLIGALE